MKKTIAVLIVGVVLGAALTVYLLGRPRSQTLPGIPLKPPDNSQTSSGTVAVSIDEKFFDSLLGTIFQKLGPPQLKLSRNDPIAPTQPAMFQTACNDVLMLAQEDGNVKTGVRFTGGKIAARVAFTGSYNILGRCAPFKGWASTTVDLSFDQEKQMVYGRVSVDEVPLDDTPPIVSNLVTAFVRKTISDRVNPFEVLRVSQLALALPVHASGGNLNARVKDVRAEVQEGSLRLYLTYDFSAERNAG
jgi:hypothetical protein